MNIDNLDLKQFCTIVIASKRYSGKTMLVRNIIKYMFDNYTFNNIIIFSKTAHISKEYDYINEKSL